VKLTSRSFEHDRPIPPEFAFGKIDPVNHFAFSQNRNPELSWSEVPTGCKSLVLTCVDRDVPTVGDDVNQEGKVVPADLPRTDFTHWLLVDIPPTCTSIEAGACSDGVTQGGKSGPAGPGGSRQGVNDYTGWFAGDEDMGGTYLGYDGPGPPWNDELIHHYEFRIYALDVERLPVVGEFRLDDVETAMEGHVLGEALLTGTYTLNPKLA
jgi:Raf kinase inhibitor-like YbhB/YbcL family protein